MMQLGTMMNYQLTIDRILEHANRMYPNKLIKTKLPDGEMISHTYANLYDRSKRLGNVLEMLGVKPGDRVGTFAWNNIEHVEFYFGIPGAGAICHTLNIRLFADQLSYVVNHAEDKVIFIDGTLIKLFEKASDNIKGVEHYILFNTPKDVETTLDNVLHYEDLMDEVDADFEWKSTDENMGMAMCYTSGTTGVPKGVIYSHRSMYLHTLGENLANAIALTESDVVLPVVPQFHAMAWGLPYAAAMVGAELVLPGPHIKPEPLAEMIADEKVTFAAGVPTLWNGLYHELAKNPRDISSVRALLVGGSAMPRSLIEAYEKDLNISVLHAWGMTETSPFGSISKLLKRHKDLPPNEQWDLKAKQGYAVLGIEMRIISEEGEELAWDGVAAGELQVRGPWTAGSYYNQESEQFTEDGWFRTGDVATINNDGFMTVTDRTKDLIKSGGEWISSVELENALIAHPEVLEAAVIAIPDVEWSERPLAVTVRVPGKEIMGEELEEFLIPKFAKFWLPDGYVFIDEIPKTSVGKFDKKVLRQRYSDGQLG